MQTDVLFGDSGGLRGIQTTHNATVDAAVRETLQPPGHPVRTTQNGSLSTVATARQRASHWLDDGCGSTRRVLWLVKVEGVAQLCGAEFGIGKMFSQS